MTNRLREIRLQNNILQSQAADDLDISIRNLSRYENGEIEPPIGLAMRMAAYYCRTIEELFQPAEPMKGGSAN